MFNFAVVNAGQRNVDVHSELVACSTPGQFRLTGPACKLLGVKPTDYVTFLHDEESDTWAIARGFVLRNADGSAQKVTPREAKSIVTANFDDMLAKAMESGDEKLVAALSVEGMTTEDKIDILCKCITTDKYQGSKTANPAKAIGIGAPVTFTDSHIWAELKKDVKDPKSVNRVFSLEDSEVLEIELPDGYQGTTTKALVLGSYADEAPARRGEESAE